ncbi:hypothetical protein D0T51_07670 [Parabacteroides sp. 52]|uniref:Mfa1 family fimbria major subunit n=1 Tax=unclassified Parabacteroides TaxID=2649774 RepID=UPI0013D5236D|nr:MULTISPECIES: Mfa1 family fimbria major subunit [unclassified Parabacteroides]MDH6534888.1 hypothetical protein [Parabacteroides sp. PM5-20]NDV55605.1 hypothetical protein [Parabacteroides sp. 52]
MKYRHLFYLFVILIQGSLFWAGCTYEDIPGKEEDKKKPDLKEEAFFSVLTDMDESLHTKAGSDDLGLPEERKVNSVRLVLYDGEIPLSADPEVKYVFDLDIRTNSGATGYEAGTPGDLFLSVNNQEFITFARRVVKQKYRMLVILNPVSAVKAITRESDHLSTFLQEVNMDKNTLTATGGVAQKNAFMMTNHQGLIDISLADLKETADQAHMAPVAVKVDRLVAKVIVDKKADTDFSVLPEGARVRDFSWELDVTNKKTYWMRVMAPMMNGSMEVIGANRDWIYAEDPNFQGLNTGVAATDELNREANFNYIAKATLYPVLSNKFDSDATATAAEKYQYALENTMAADEQVNDVMTRVVIRCQYAPPGFAFGESYYLYKGVVINQTHMSFYRTADIGQIPDALSDIKEAIWNVEEHSGFSILSPPASSYDMYGIKYFYQGYCYYRVPIRHFACVKTDPLPYGYYGMVRNNTYKISISSIDGPGGIHVGEPGPFISAGVHVVPWGVVEEKEEIGNPVVSVITYNYYYQNADLMSFVYLGTKYVTDVPVGSAFPTLSTSILNAWYTLIPETVGGSAAFVTPGWGIEPSLPTVSMDYTKNVYHIFYNRQKKQASLDVRSIIEIV